MGLLTAIFNASDKQTVKLSVCNQFTEVFRNITAGRKALESLKVINNMDGNALPSGINEDVRLYRNLR